MVRNIQYQLKMKNKFNYTTMKTLLAKINRDLRDTDISESDIVEWAGEALGYMKIIEIQEEALAFLEVKDYQAELPRGFQYVIQIAKNNKWKNSDGDGVCPLEIITDMEHHCNTTVPDIPTTDNTISQYISNLEGLTCTDCLGKLIEGEDLVYYRPFFDLKYEYSLWMTNTYYRDTYTPVRLSNHSFMGSLVAEESEDIRRGLYDNSRDEYTIVGGFPNLCLRFSFPEGLVALSYVRTMIDNETGYPLIPDDSSFIAAITYYIKWKISERLRWSGREGFASEAQEAEKHWLKYLRQSLNKAKMPQGVDDYQDIMEESMYLIPRFRKYYGYFGKLGREEERLFNNPDRRRKFSLSRYGRY